MDHASEAEYFIKRADQSRTAALDAADVTSRTAHEHLTAAYEVRSEEATAASTTSARRPVLHLIGEGLRRERA